VFQAALARSADRAVQVAEGGAAAEHAARQAASVLYQLTTAVAMAWEAGRTGCTRRMRLAQWTLRQRLLPQDPLAPSDEPAWLVDLLEPGSTPPAEAVQAVLLF
jgi:acyl-CoA dehydrogenase